MNKLQWKKQFLAYSPAVGDIPSQYQEVEYIQSTGTQVIQIPYLCVEDTIIEATFSLIADSGYYSWGYYNTSRFYIRMNSPTSTGWTEYTFMNAAQVGTAYPDPQDEKFKFNTYKFDKTGWYRNNVLVKAIGSYTATQATSTGFSIFGYNEYPTSALVKHKELKIYTGDTLSVELHPIRQKNGNQGGMYDVVNQVAYLDTGFVYGDDIE